MKATASRDTSQTSSNADTLKAVRLVASGCGSAEHQLFHEYLVPLRRFALSLTKNTTSADDLTQETLRVVLEKLRAGELREADKFWPFLKGTARNLFLYEMRKFRRRNTWSMPELPDRADEGAEPLESLLTAETTTVVRRLLGQLGTQRDREILTRAYLRDESSESICRDLGLNREHLHRVMFRARRRLKQLALKDPAAAAAFSKAA